MTDHYGVEIGAVLAGSYRVERVLGRGGMGVVVEATHCQHHRRVAMKLLLPHVLDDPRAVQRFLREAQATLRLKSEHVARVIDVGAFETGAPYMVLEYLDGADLTSFPRSELTVGAIVNLVLQACEALAEAHSLGIVHRDIKPGNLFVTRSTDGALLLKVLDFGISKSLTTGHRMTASQTLMGTPAYMSPEQLRSSRNIDHRSDIWSLGVVLYELLQGSPPFEGDTFASMVLTTANEPTPKLTVRLPDGLDDVVYRCLEKDPASRFQTIAELASALSTYAQSAIQAALSVQRTRVITCADLPGIASRACPTVPARPTTISGSAISTTTPQRAVRRWPLLAAAGAVVSLLLVAIVGPTGGLFRGHTNPDPARSGPPRSSSPPLVTAPVQPPAGPPSQDATTTKRSVSTPAPVRAPTYRMRTGPAAPARPAAVPTRPTSRRSRKPTNTSSTPPKPAPASAVPWSEDDDVLGTRK